MNLAELRAQLIGWLEEFIHWPTHTGQNWSDYVMTNSEWRDYKWPYGPPLQRKLPPPDDNNHMHLHVFTENTEYHLGCSIKDDGNVIMMGSTQCRKPRPGENWLRGNDFTEGEFSKETLTRFFLDIARYEIIAKVKKYIPCSEGDGNPESPDGSPVVFEKEEKGE